MFLDGFYFVGTGSFTLTGSRVFFLIYILVFILQLLSFNKLRVLTLKVKLILMLLFFYALLLMVSGVWAAEISKAIIYFLYYAWYLIIIVIMIFSRPTKDDLDRFLSSWLLVGFIVTLLCYVEMFTEFRFSSSRYLLIPDMNTGLNTPTSTFQNENNLAVFLGLTVYIIISRMPGLNAFRVIFYWTWLLSCLLIMFVTDARGGMVMMLIALIHFYLKSSATSKLVIFTLIVSFLFIYQGRANEITSSLENSFYISNDDIRIKLINASLESSSQNGFLGVGGGQVELFISNSLNLEITAVHNWMMEVLANTGILGTLAWVCILICIFAFIICNKNIMREHKLRDFLLLSWGSFIIWQSVVSSMINFIPFWLIIGYSLTVISTYNGTSPKLVGEIHRLTPSRVAV